MHTAIPQYTVTVSHTRWPQASPSFTSDYTFRPSRFSSETLKSWEWPGETRLTLSPLNLTTTLSLYRVLWWVFLSLQSIINQEVDPSDQVESQAGLHCTIFTGHSQIHPLLHVWCLHGMWPRVSVQYQGARGRRQWREHGWRLVSQSIT